MFSPVHTRSTDKRVSQAETVTAYGLEFMAMEFYLKQQRWANAQCPPLPRDSADRGGATGGGVRQRFRVELQITVCFPIFPYSYDLRK